VNIGKIGLVVIGASAVLAAFVAVRFRAEDFPESGRADDGHAGNRGIATVVGSGRTETRIRPAGSLAPSKAEGDDGLVKGKSLSDNGADADDEKLFNEVVAGLYSELVRACQEKNTVRLRELIDKLKAIGGNRFASLSRSKIPVGAIKSKILEGLGSLGPESANEIMEYLGDEDAMVAKSAENALFELMNDLSLGDYRLGELVAEAAKELTDEYAISRLYNQFVRMRHSVGCEVFAEIMASGTDQAKASLPRAIGAFTSDVRITTVDQLDGWLAEHPDTKHDDQMYGPIIIEKVE